MGNIVPRPGIESMSLTFQVSVLPLNHVTFHHYTLMSSLCAHFPVYAAPCLRGQCTLLRIMLLCGIAECVIKTIHQSNVFFPECNFTCSQNVIRVLANESYIYAHHTPFSIIIYLPKSPSLLAKSSISSMKTSHFQNRSTYLFLISSLINHWCMCYHLE